MVRRFVHIAFLPERFQGKQESPKTPDGNLPGMKCCYRGGGRWAPFDLAMSQTALDIFEAFRRLPHETLF